MELKKTSIILIKGTEQDPARYLYILLKKEILQGLIVLNQPLFLFEEKLYTLLEKNGYGKRNNLSIIDNLNSLSPENQTSVYASLDNLFKDKRIHENDIRSTLGISKINSRTDNGTLFIDL